MAGTSLKKLFFCSLFNLLAVLDLVYEDLGWLKARDKMLLNHKSSVSGNIPGDLTFAFLVDEAAKPTDINVVTVRHGVLYNTKKSLHRCSHVSFIHSGLLRDLVYYICFSHFR
jgi:hypothetical protein